MIHILYLEIYNIFIPKLDIYLKLIFNCYVIFRLRITKISILFLFLLFQD